MKTNTEFRSWLLIIVLTFMVPTVILANVYTVTNTADAGAGSLRQAIINANANAGKDTIRFNIAAGGNLFEGSGANTYAVIELITALPTITGSLFIDGASQTNTNTGSSSGYTVGADAIAQSAINYPDVYIVPHSTFVFPINSNGVTGDGISVDINDVTISGIAISGFGNTHTNGGIASGHADIQVLRAPAERTANITITNSFISCDPLGAFPALAHRRTKGNGILIAGNNSVGSISNNYIAHSGTYGIHFNGNIDNNNVGPASTTVGSRNWTISGNRLISISTNATISGITRVSDAITLMKCVLFRVENNYITDAEQMGVDIGYNSDSNRVENNTVTGFVKTTALAPQAGLRIGLCSERDTLIKNLIYNNSGTSFRGGVWLDESTLTQTGITTKDNQNNLIQENIIHSNTGSGIVLSNNSSGQCINNVITRNSTYNNTGLGIDLNYNGTAGPVTVSLDDDGDGDTGPNNIQNFPLIDSVRKLTATTVAFYGKAPAGATIEFFITDAQTNMHGGTTLNYGEGRTYIGTLVEGSGADMAAGVGSYNVDGNVATANTNMFAVVLTYTGGITFNDFVTSTATVANNTSEFGPVVTVLNILDVKLINFFSTYKDGIVKLNWQAVTDKSFQYFDVEHSTDGVSFARLKTVNPKAEGTIADYQFDHAGAAEGNNFYRLRMVTNSGKVSYSSVLRVSVKDAKTKQLNNVNSFFKNKIELKLNSDKEEAIVAHLFNQAGKLIKYTEVRGNAGTNFIQMDGLDQAAAGTYVLYIKKGEETFTQRLIKQ